MTRPHPFWTLAVAAFVLGCPRAPFPVVPAAVPTPPETAPVVPSTVTQPDAAGPIAPAPAVVPVVPVPGPSQTPIVTVIPPVEAGAGGGGGGGIPVPPAPAPTPTLLTHTHIPPTVTLVTSNPPTAEPPAPSAFTIGTKLACVGAATGNNEIYLTNSDGTGRQQLTSDPGSDLYPRMSADRREIVWCSDRGAGIFAVYRMWADGSHPFRVTFGRLPATQPAFSPDGSKIAFVRWTGPGTSVISVVNRDGTNEVALSPDGGQAFSPAWSPDGLQLAFASNHADGATPVLYRMPAGGGALSAVSHGATDFPTGGVDWSPNGTRLAYATNVSNHGLGITLIDPSGANRLELSHANDTDPAWSSDGSKLLYTTLASGISQLATMNANGTGVASLTSGTSTSAQGTW